jgi:putative RecB family exonuclease
VTSSSPGRIATVPAAGRPADVVAAVIAAAGPADASEPGAETPSAGAASQGSAELLADDHHRVASLSPSRASDFMTCPLLYRFRVIDRLPEPPGWAASRGTLVHAVLETLFDLPSDQRTFQRAAGLLPEAWQGLLDRDDSLQQLFEAVENDPDGDQGLPAVPAVPQQADAASDPPAPVRAPVDEFLAEAENLLGRYFTLEDPSRLEPAERELLVTVPLASGLLLRGIVDRIDVAPGGQVRVVDYKTGQAPSEVFEAKALFQMKFYALVLWRLRGTIPAMLQLVYLGGEGTLMRYQPEERDLLATERKLNALWQAIERAYEKREFLPSPSRVCSWCDYKALCPAFDGTPPPLPDPLPVPAVESVAELADSPD